MIDCSEGVELLEDLSHHHEEGEEDHDGHDHGHWDPHYWMDPRRAAQMVGNLEAGLSALDPDNEQNYAQNSFVTRGLLIARDNNARELLDQYGTRHGTHPLELITFHDGFQYFADAYGLTLLTSIEEEGARYPGDLHRGQRLRRHREGHQPGDRLSGGSAHHADGRPGQ